MVEKPGWRRARITFVDLVRRMEHSKHRMLQLEKDMDASIPRRRLVLGQAEGDNAGDGTAKRTGFREGPTETSLGPAFLCRELQGGLETDGRCRG